MIALYFIHTYPNLPHTICSILSYLWGKQAQILKSSIHSQQLNGNQKTENSSAATSAPIFNVHATQPLTITFTSYVFFTDPSWCNACVMCMIYFVSVLCTFFHLRRGDQDKLSVVWLAIVLNGLKIWTEFTFVKDNTLLWVRELCFQSCAGFHEWVSQFSQNWSDIS